MRAAAGPKSENKAKSVNFYVFPLNKSKEKSMKN